MVVETLKDVWYMNVIKVLDFEKLFCIVTSGNQTPGSRFYSDLLDTLADSVCIHHVVLKRRSKRYAARVIVGG